METPQQKKYTRRRRRRQSIFTEVMEAKEVSSLPEFFVLMAYENNESAAYCTVLSKLKRKEENIGTMGVKSNSNGSATLLYDPLFNDLVKKKVNWVLIRMILIHELTHLQSGHPARVLILWLSEEDKEMFKKISPIAVDFSCNSIAVHWGLYSLTDLLSSPPHVVDETGAPVTDELGRHVSEFRGMYPTEEPYNLHPRQSYEAYYRKLKDIMQGKPPEEWSKRGFSDEEQQEMLSKCQQAIESSGGDGKKWIHIEDINLDDLNQEDIDTIINESERLSNELNSGVLSELKSRGLGSGSLAQSLEVLLRAPQVPWSFFLKAFVKKASLKGKKKKSIRHYNRRKGESDLWSPYPGKHRERKVKALVVFDTSGSVSDAEFNELRNEVLALHSLLSEVTVLYVDSIVQKVETLTAQSTLPDKVYGRGGTSFDPAFQWARENKFNPDIIIYGTDGEAPLPSPSLRLPIPVLWVVSSRGVMPGAYTSMEEGKLHHSEYGAAVKLGQL